MRKAKRLSSVDLLPDELRDAINKAIREGRSTIDQILQHLKSIAPDGMNTPLPSRSAIGRYKKSAQDVMGARIESVEISKIWAEELAENPKGDVGTLLRQLLETAAFQKFLALTEGDGARDADPQGLMFLGRLVKDLGATEKMKLERVIKEDDEREKRAKAAAAKAGGALKKAGVSPETIKLIETQILGIAKP